MEGLVRMTFPQIDVAVRVVDWQSAHGRNHLPWQQTRDPYKVWLSEIMLQQTQVSTVLDYYGRFLERFPDVSSLAAASQEDVLALWSGLGYYSRARNLHQCAQQVLRNHGGVFPDRADLLVTLPGIGRSTAGAIAAFCFSERTPILDANVRRVLTRLLGFASDLALVKNERTLWAHAASLLPVTDLVDSMPRYTQGLMDLGASLCVPRKPLCSQCPLQSLCVAYREGDPEKYPVKTRKLVRRSESWWLLILKDRAGRVLLQLRPSKGIWAGLYCVPVFPDATSLMALLSGSSFSNISIENRAPFLHVLTHRDLYLHPVVAECDAEMVPQDLGDWFAPEQWGGLGLPAPIRKFLDSL
ncbi:MAG: A/G-specific adenine glycosylase [Burkholderiaceae bacterium]|nr:A/G-specific adenine glycosylase [Burkholderiaceae bacterium]